MTAVASLLVIAATIYAILRRVEARLVLLLGAAALGVLAGRPFVILQTFLDYLTREQFILPLGCCLGFAYVLRHTGCDQHLVHLLARPLRGARPVLVPGVVLVGVLVNVPIVSQTSTLALVGSVLIPLLRAARVSALTTGAALVLGCSIGGELLNPAAVELRSVTDAINARARALGEPEASSVECVLRAWPLLLVHVLVAVPLFWALCERAERGGPAAGPEPDEPPTFRVNVLKALVPLVPVTLLFLTALPPPLRAFTVPRHALLPPGSAGSFDARLIAAAMLVGVVVAALTNRSRVAYTAGAFFEGLGYAMTHIISLIVAANCFGDGVKESGLGDYLERAIVSAPALLRPLAAVVPLLFAWGCGSGMATTQTLFRFFLEPTVTVGEDPFQVGAVVSVAAAAGRTMSPVAAVVILGAKLAGADPLAVVRRTALPLLAGMIGVVVAALL
jgi:DcuC family C4-dicarboxylate transporter